MSEPEITPATRQRQTAAITHGLFVKAPSGLKLRARKVRILARRVWKTLPWLQPSDEPAVRGWCELQLVTSTMFVKVLKGESDPNAWRQLVLARLQYERELGMTPSSRMAMGLTSAQGQLAASRLHGAAGTAIRDVLVNGLPPENQDA